MKPKIAVVEDNLDNRLLVQAILEDDYEISEYESGMEVVEALPMTFPTSFCSTSPCREWMVPRCSSGFGPKTN